MKTQDEWMLDFLKRHPNEPLFLQIAAETLWPRDEKLWEIVEKIKTDMLRTYISSTSI